MTNSEGTPEEHQDRKTRVYICAILAILQYFIVEYRMNNSFLKAEIAAISLSSYYLCDLSVKMKTAA